MYISAFNSNVSWRKKKYSTSFRITFLLRHLVESIAVSYGASLERELPLVCRLRRFGDPLTMTALAILVFLRGIFFGRVGFHERRLRGGSDEKRLHFGFQ